MNTDKPTTTASATPEKVRIYIDNEREPGLRNYVETGRTIPAEKPTAIKTSQPIGDSEAYRIGHHDAMMEYLPLAEEMEAHAAQLAEGIKKAIQFLEQGNPEQAEIWLRHELKNL